MPTISELRELDDETLERMLIEETKRCAGFTPRDWQVRIAIAVIRGRDILLLAGTGFGKTLTFILALFLCERMIVWVLSLLNYIENQQVKVFTEWGVAAAAVKETTDFGAIKSDILRGRYQVVISSPESCCKANKLRQVVVSKELSDWFQLTVVDEAHCVFTWGKEFRPGYKRCGTMRAFMPPQSPLLAATATCTAEIKATLIKQLYMANNLLVENLGNFRANLQYEVYRMSGGLQAYHELRKLFPSSDPEQVPQTIIFVNTVADSHMIVHELRKHLEWEGDRKELIQGRGGRSIQTKCRAVMMVTADQYKKAILKYKALTGASGATPNIKQEEPSSEINVDMLEEMIGREEGEPTVSSESESEETNLDSTMEGTRRQEPGSLRARGGRLRGQSRSRGSTHPRLSGQAMRSKALDPEVAKFIGTRSCRVEVLDRIFDNPEHEACETVVGCDNCIEKQAQTRAHSPDRFALDRAVKREVIDLEIILKLIKLIIREGRVR